MFQTQMYFDGFKSTPSIARDITINRSLSLLRMTQHARDGHHRLSTPDKMAVLELSTGFEKKRLGKQQQILSDIASRCREQEIGDLSSRIAGRMVLKDGQSAPEVAPYMTTYMAKRDKYIEATYNKQEISQQKDQPIRQQILQHCHPNFPARKIIKRPGKAELQRRLLPKVNASYVKGMPPSITNCKPRMLNVYSNPINGPIQLEHYMQSASNNVLAPLRDTGSLESEYRNRIDSFFSTTRVSLGLRSKTVQESGSGASGTNSCRTLAPLKSEERSPISYTSSVTISART